MWLVMVLRTAAAVTGLPISPRARIAVGDKGQFPLPLAHQFGDQPLGLTRP